MRSIPHTVPTHPTVVRVRGRGVRVAPWQRDVGICQVSPLVGELPPTVELLREVTDRLRGLGVRDIVTGALTEGEEGPFVEAGFVERDRLHLLRREIEEGFEAAVARAPEIRKPRRHDWPAVVTVDARAFQPFWHLDADGIDDAARATPTSRTRVATLADRVVGYAVHGRSGRRGYVQRLAVDPDVSGHGVGTALLLDGLGWMAERGAVEALVNTQTSNERALSLYLRHGFVLQPGPLLVLGVRLSEA